MKSEDEWISFRAIGVGVVCLPKSSITAVWRPTGRARTKIKALGHEVNHHYLEYETNETVDRLRDMLNGHVTQ